MFWVYIILYTLYVCVYPHRIRFLLKNMLKRSINLFYIKIFHFILYEKIFYLLIHRSVTHTEENNVLLAEDIFDITPWFIDSKIHLLMSYYSSKMSQKI